MALVPINHVNIAEQVFDQLKMQILNGNWKEEEKLPSELELTELLGVSRSTIRQALRTLADYGLVETRNGTGTYVKHHIFGNYMMNIVPVNSLQMEDIVEVLDFLCLIEDNVAAMAAERCTEQDIIILQNLNAELKECVGDVKKLTELDLAFHLKIAKITKNSLTIQTYSILNELMETAMYTAYTRLGAGEGIPYHEELMKALATHNAAQAKTVMSAHVQNRRAKFAASLSLHPENP